MSSVGCSGVLVPGDKRKVMACEVGLMEATCQGELLFSNAKGSGRLQQSTHQEVLLDCEVLCGEGPFVHDDVAFLYQAFLYQAFLRKGREV